MIMTLIKRNESLFPGIWNNFFENEWLDIPSVNQIGASLPAVNILDTGQSFEIQIAAPGMKKEHFNVTLNEGLLTVSSERKEEKETSHPTDKYTHREFNYYSFKRSFNLPETVDREKVVANYQDGVLLINIPKLDNNKSNPMRLIEVK